MASRVRFVMARRAVAVAAIVLATVSPAAGPAWSAEPTDGFDRIDATVRAAMEDSAIPGLAYALVEDGAMVHAAAFGTAGRGAGPMTVDTPLVIGSVGKSITALAVRQLAEAGRVDVDAPLTAYLPWFKLADTAATGRVTVRSLLDHTSGLSTAAGQDPRWYRPGLAAEGVARDLAAWPMDGTPGAHAYSNANYLLLGLVIEAASGMPYGDYLRTSVFGPLGMDRSATDPGAAAVAGAAQGHRYLFGVPIPFDEPYPTAMVAAGYQLSTAADMARFCAALANGGVIDGVDIVASGAPAVRDAGQRTLDTSWRPLPAGSANAIVSQSGSTLASNADILVVPSTRRGVVVMLNGNPTQLLGLPAGAAEIAMAAHHAWTGSGPTVSAPTVRTVYLGVGAVLLVLVVAFLAHATRTRSWRRRLAATAHPRRLVARTFAEDFVLPVAVLLLLPMWIAATGSSRPGDLVAGWSFALWTLPDLAGAALALAVGGLAIGAVRLAWLRGGVAAARGGGAARGAAAGPPEPA